MSDTLTREEHDAKLAATEARSDARFSELRGEFGELRGELGELRGDLRALDGKISALPSTFTVTTTIFATGIAITGAILAALAFGSGLFGQGVSAYDIAHRAATDALAQSRAAAGPSPSARP